MILNLYKQISVDCCLTQYGMNRKIISEHHFGFKSSDSTIDQVHRIKIMIKDTLLQRKICSANFLDISQTVDKPCHTQSIRKLSRQFPPVYCTLMELYLERKSFRIKQETKGDNRWCSFISAIHELVTLSFLPISIGITYIE